MSSENIKNNNDDFLKKYNEVFKDSFPASQSKSKASDENKSQSEIHTPKTTPVIKPVIKKKSKPKSSFSFKKLLPVFKKRKKEHSPEKVIDIDIYSTDDIDLPLDLPKNLMDPESTEIQMTMFEGVEDSETYQKILYSEEETADNNSYTDEENENQIRIEDLIKENIIASRKADPYADKLQYDANEPVESDDADKFGDTMTFEPVRANEFQYKSVDEILREVSLPSDEEDSKDGQTPRRRRAGAAD